MTRTATIQAEYDDEIEEALERFADHEGMSDGRVLKWLSQFEDEDLPLAAHILESVQYINGTNIRGMSRDLFLMANDELARRGLNHAAFVAVGNPGSGSGVITRVLRESIRDSNHANLSMWQVATATVGRYDAVVFVDDFSGTGNTLEEWWANVESVIRPLTTQVFVGLLLVTQEARQRIEDFAQVLAVSELNRGHNILAAESNLLTAEQKERVREYCVRTGTDAMYHEGYGGCALLLAFKHGCPDNSVPILWEKTDGWRPLFNRSVI